LGAAAFRDITSGNNGAYQAAAGWDPCTGLGSPKAAAVISSLVASAKS
jgi:kumamolisin